jgi:hypothetical protein
MARELDESDLGRLDNSRECASDTNSDLYSELSSADRHEGSSSDDPVCTDLQSNRFQEQNDNVWGSLRLPQRRLWARRVDAPQ